MRSTDGPLAPQAFTARATKDVPDGTDGTVTLLVGAASGVDSAVAPAKSPASITVVVVPAATVQASVTDAPSTVDAAWPAAPGLPRSPR